MDLQISSELKNTTTVSNIRILHCPSNYSFAIDMFLSYIENVSDGNKEEIGRYRCNALGSRDSHLHLQQVQLAHAACASVALSHKYFVDSLFPLDTIEVDLSGGISLIHPCCKYLELNIGNIHLLSPSFVLHVQYEVKNYLVHGLETKDAQDTDVQISVPTRFTHKIQICFDAQPP